MSKNLHLAENISLHLRLSVEQTPDILWADSNEKLLEINQNYILAGCVHYFSATLLPLLMS